MAYYVYLVECSDSSFYCGCTKNLKERVRAHNGGKGGRYTRGKRPVKLVFSEKKKTLGDALRREREIKSFSKKKKQLLVKGLLP